MTPMNVKVSDQRDDHLPSEREPDPESATGVSAGAARMDGAFGADAGGKRSTCMSIL